MTGMSTRLDDKEVRAEEGFKTARVWCGGTPGDLHDSSCADQWPAPCLVAHGGYSVHMNDGVQTFNWKLRKMRKKTNRHRTELQAGKHIWRSGEKHTLSLSRLNTNAVRTQPSSSHPSKNSYLERPVHTSDHSMLGPMLVVELTIERKVRSSLDIPRRV